MTALDRMPWLRPVVFNLESTQRQVVLGSGPEQLQPNPSIGFNQVATSSTRRRRGHDEAGYGSLLRLVVFDLGPTQGQVARGLGPEQLKDEAGQGALIRLVVLALGSIQRQVVLGSGPEQL